MTDTDKARLRKREQRWRESQVAAVRASERRAALSGMAKAETIEELNRLRQRAEHFGADTAETERVYRNRAVDIVGAAFKGG